MAFQETMAACSPDFSRHYLLYKASQSNVLLFDAFLPFFWTCNTLYSNARIHTIVMVQTVESPETNRRLLFCDVSNAYFVFCCNQHNLQQVRIVCEVSVV